MKSNGVKISWFGIVLIVTGIIMLLDRLHVVDLEFSMILWPLMMLVGLVTVGRGYSQNRRTKIFWGTVLFLYSLFFFLKSSEYFELYAYMFFPASFLIFGIAFFMMYLNDTKDWPLIIPAFILITVGSMFMLTEYGYLYRWEVCDILGLYWPVILILLGVTIILRSKHCSRFHQSAPDPPPPPAE